MNPQKAASSRKVAKARKTKRPGPMRSSEPTLSSKDIIKVVKLLKGASSIELKLSVPAAGHRATIASIGLDPVEAQPRQAFFFDTPELALNEAGLVVRARRIQGGRADTVVKLRPVDPARLTQSFVARRASRSSWM